MSVQKLSINNFAQAGLNSDVMPWDLPPQFLTEIKNIRVFSSRVSNYRGSGEWIGLPTDFIPGHILHVGSTTGAYWVILGMPAELSTAGNAYAFNGTIFTDISLIGAYDTLFDVIPWQSCILSNIPIVNNIGTYPQYWGPQTPTTTLEYLPWIIDPVTPANDKTWKDVDERAKIIRSHKQYLFALNLISAGVSIPDGVRWSAPADTNGLPQTWDPLDFTNVAGFTTLGADGGQIIDGLSLRDAFVVYRERAIAVFDYIGGQYLWQIRVQTSTFGLISQDCLVEVNSNHYFIGQEDIYINDGNAITPLLHGKLARRFNNEFDKSKSLNAYAVIYDILDEIWFCIPTYTSGNYAALAFVHNWRDNSWTIIDLPNKITRHMAYGPVDTITNEWNASPGSWNQNSGPWNFNGGIPINKTLVGVQAPGETNPGGVALLDPLKGALVTIDPLRGTGLFTEPPDIVVLERTGFLINDLSNVTTITRVYPRMEGDAEVYIKIGSQDFVGGPIRWKDPVIFRPNIDRKIDVRTTGELHCFNVTSVDQTQGASWSLSGWDIEFVEAGAR